MSKQKIDPTLALIESVLARPIPQEGQLIHPLAKKTRAARKGGQVRISDLVSGEAKKSPFPEDVTEFTTRTFVDYFAYRYGEEVGGNYRKIYKADGQIFQSIFNALSSNGLEPKEWTYKLLDWAFQRRDMIVRRHGHFTPQEILRMVNYFIQDVVLPEVEQGSIQREIQDCSLLKEIQEADQQGRATEIYVRFGIPVAVSYYVLVRKFNKDKVLSATTQRLNSLATGSAVEKEQLGKILHASVIGSPYPRSFEATNWRTEYASCIGNFRNETWWRDHDYRGEPLPKYNALLDNVDG